MEYIIMFILHIIKTAEYFAVSGLPEIPPEQLPAAIEGFILNLVKLAEIYASMF